MKLTLLLLFISSLAFGQQIKFSELPAATTLGGTEIVPAVQSGGNVKISINQILQNINDNAAFWKRVGATTLTGATTVTSAGEEIRIASDDATTQSAVTLNGAAGTSEFSAKNLINLGQYDGAVTSTISLQNGDINLSADGDVTVNDLDAGDTIEHILVRRESDGVLLKRSVSSISSANIYNSDGTVTAARTIDGGNNSMLWHTFDVFEVYSNSLIWQAGNHTIDLGTDLRLEADGDIDLDATDDLKINATSGTTGQFIGNTDGHAAWVAPTNIFTSNGSLTSNRTLDGDAFNLTLTDIGTFAVNATGLGIYSTGAWSGSSDNNITLQTLSGDDIILNSNDDVNIAPVDDLQLNGVAGTTGEFIGNSNGHAVWSAITISTVVPVTPTDGMIWIDGTDLKIRISGTTYTLTKTP